MKIKLTFAAFCLLLTIQSTAGTEPYHIIKDWLHSVGRQDTIYKVPSSYDVAGNFIIAAFTIDSLSGADIVVSEYDTNGTPRWSRTWTGFGYNRDQPIEVSTDDSCNVYVGGFTFSDTTNLDYVVVKYDSSGNQKWVYKHNGSANNYDVPVAIKQTGSFVYIAGESFNQNTLLDFTTIQLDRATGTENWIRYYDRNSLYDVPYFLLVTDSTVAVIGGSQQSITEWFYYGILYDSTGSVTDTLYGVGTSSSFDRPTAAREDSAGNLYITGIVVDSLGDQNVRTVKLSQDGDVEWSVDWGTDSTADIGNDVLIDTNGNVFVCGATDVSSEGTNYLLIKYDSTGVVLWDTTYDGSGFDDQAFKMAFDEYGNVIMTGYRTFGSKDFFTEAVRLTAAEIFW